MDDGQREHLTGHFAVAEWPKGNLGLIQAPEPDAVDLRGWTLVRSQPLHLPDARTSWRALWSRPQAAGQVLIRVDLIETTGPEAAQEQLLRQLGEFQSPDIRRYPDPPAGEIAFGPLGEATLVFMRANVVVALRNAEREVVSVLPHALRIDEHLRAFRSGS